MENTWFIRIATVLVFVWCEIYKASVVMNTILKIWSMYWIYNYLRKKLMRQVESHGGPDWAIGWTCTVDVINWQGSSKKHPRDRLSPQSGISSSMPLIRYKLYEKHWTDHHSFLWLLRILTVYKAYTLNSDTYLDLQDATCTSLCETILVWERAELCQT